jgi:hypothetical protein
MGVNEESLIDLLRQLQRGEVFGATASRLLRKRLLAVGSVTPDNVNCADHVEVGKVRPVVGPIEVTGIKVRKRPIRVSEVIHRLEDIRVPKVIRDEFPELTRGEWCACIRITTLIMLSIEHQRWPPRGDADGG